MATPPKSPPRRVGAKKVSPPVTVPFAAPTVQDDTPPIETETVDKPMPFVIEPEAESALADTPLTEEQSESVFLPESEPAAPLTGETEVEPIETTEDVPVIETPAIIDTPTIIETPTITDTIVETEAPTLPQPDVAEPLAAATDTAADWQSPHALKGYNVMTDAYETGTQFAEETKSRLQSIVGDFNEKAKSAVEKSSKAAEELSDIAKGNLEALVESSKIAAKGFESLGQSAAEYGRASFEKTSATIKSFASVKSPTEFFQLQSELVTSTFDALAAETAKTSEAFLKLAGEIAQPLSSRASVVSDKIKALAA